MEAGTGESHPLHLRTMRWPLFRKERSHQAQLEAQAEMERRVAEGLRVLGRLFTRAAELVDAQRLSKKGYGDQEVFLERLDRGGRAAPGSSPETASGPRAGSPTGGKA